MPYGSSSSKSGYGGGAAAPAKKKPGILDRVIGGPAGLVMNLSTDVRDAVVGLPAGLVLTAQHPLRVAKLTGEQTWQTWSPLFKGHPEEFAAAFYDHPLAPILDVATVFTLGAGSVARGAKVVSEAGIGGERTAAIAALRSPKEIKLFDPTDKGRHVVHKQLSTRAGRRIVQEGIMSLEAHLPKWGGQGQKLGSALARSRYESRFLIDMAHRSAAKNLQLVTMLKAGEKLSDDSPDAPLTRAELLAGNHLGAMRHNEHLAITPEEAIERGWLKKDGTVNGKSHYRPIIAPAHVDRGSESALYRLQKQEERLDKQRAANAELAHAVPRIEQELADVNDQLAKMHREGWVVPNATARPGTKAIQEQEAAAVMDYQRAAVRLEDQLAKARTAKTKHDAAINELADVKANRMDAERRGFTEKYMAQAQSAESFEKAARNFGKLITTTDLRRAARTSDGRIRFIPKHDATLMGHEMANSSKFMRMIWDKPTYLWKMAMIGYTPRSIVNNGVGNWAMYALREGGGVDAVKALYDAVRLTHGEEGAMRSMRAAVPFHRNNWLYRYFGTELGNVFGHELLTDSAMAQTKKAARAGLYPIVHKLADEPVRIASISKFLREAPEVKALMKEHPKLDLDKAILQALRRNPDLKRRASEHSRVVAGDYFTLRGWEKTVRSLVPFYLWDRHIVKTTGNMFADTPGRLAVMQQISNAGIQEVEDILGDIPDFLKGAVPLSMLGLDTPGARTEVLTTASLNPWATIGEIVNLGQALTVGGNRPSDAMIGVHPFITGGIEYVTGRSVLSGAPKPTDGGLVFSVAKNSWNSLPFVQIAQEFRNADTETTDKGNPLLYARTDESAISRFLGTPIRAVDLGVAAKMAAAEGKDVTNKPKGGYGRP